MDAFGDPGRNAFSVNIPDFFAKNVTKRARFLHSGSACPNHEGRSALTPPSPVHGGSKVGPWSWVWRFASAAKSARFLLIYFFWKSAHLQWETSPLPVNCRLFLGYTNKNVHFSLVNNGGGRLYM
jgi:hypothetical protein